MLFLKINIIIYFQTKRQNIDVFEDYCAMFIFFIYYFIYLFINTATI